MEDRFVVVVDKVTARIFSCKGRPPVLKEVVAFVNPEGRMKDSELATDNVGRNYDESSPNKSGYEPHLTPREVVLLRFMKSVRAKLCQIASSRHIEVVLVAGPKVRGYLRQEFESIKTVSIVAEINKDLSEQRMEDIAQYVGREVL